MTNRLGDHVGGGTSENALEGIVTHLIDVFADTIGLWGSAHG